jgi:hypothetical protein
MPSPTYLSGGDLFSRLEDVGRFDDDDTRFYISQVILGTYMYHHTDHTQPPAGSVT